MEVDSQSDTSPWAKAGLMIRNSIAGAGSSPGYAVLALTPGNGITFQGDNDSSGGLNQVVTAGNGSVSAPIWLRLTRSGTSITGYYSTNDSTWTTVGTATLTGSNATEDVGMFATSFDASLMGRADLANFGITG